MTLFSLVPAGQILFASDAPYGMTTMSAAFMLRSALQAGLSSEQIRSIASEQALRIAAREPLQPAGAAVGERERTPHVLLDRVSEFLMLGDDRDNARRRRERRCSRSRGSRATSRMRSTTPPCSPRSAR